MAVPSWVGIMWTWNIPFRALIVMRIRRGGGSKCFSTRQHFFPTTQFDDSARLLLADRNNPGIHVNNKNEAELGLIKGMWLGDLKSARKSINTHRPVTFQLSFFQSNNWVSAVLMVRMTCGYWPVCWICVLIHLSSGDNYWASWNPQSSISLIV